MADDTSTILTGYFNVVLQAVLVIAGSFAVIEIFKFAATSLLGV